MHWIRNIQEPNCFGYQVWYLKMQMWYDKERLSRSLVDVMTDEERLNRGLVDVQERKHTSSRWNSFWYCWVRFEVHRRSPDNDQYETTSLASVYHSPPQLLQHHAAPLTVSPAVQNAPALPMTASVNTRWAVSGSISDEWTVLFNSFDESLDWWIDGSMDRSINQSIISDEFTSLCFSSILMFSDVKSQCHSFFIWFM